jgi:hypothetical protein
MLCQLLSLSWVNSAPWAMTRDPIASSMEGKTMHRRRGIVCLAALSPLLVCGAISISGCTRAQEVGSVVGLAAIVAGTTVVLVEVNKAHHTLKGCVTGGRDSLELTTQDDNKTYALSGATSNLKLGDVVKVHGSKQKAKKGGSGHRDFLVEKINRDYGPCNATPAPQAALAIR